MVFSDKLQDVINIDFYLFNQLHFEDNVVIYIFGIPFGLVPDNLQSVVKVRYSFVKLFFPILIIIFTRFERANTFGIQRTDYLSSCFRL